jgi:hypothetical protein
MPQSVYTQVLRCELDHTTMPQQIKVFDTPPPEPGHPPPIPVIEILWLGQPCVHFASEPALTT